MLLLDLTLCCFQMCIPSNETQKRRQSDLYVLEAMGGMATRLETHQDPHREPWEMGCFTERPSRVGGREEKWIQGQGHLGNTSREQGDFITLGILLGMQQNGRDSSQRDTGSAAAANQDDLA